MTIRFLPWLPPSADARFRGLRVMLLGESHYEEPGFHDADAKADLTREIVATWGVHPVSRQTFFANVFTMMTGHPWVAHAAALGTFWNSVVFYNYVQTLVPGGPRSRPTPPMWKAAAPMFLEAIEAVRPDAVVALGEALWEHMPEDDLPRASLSDGLGMICRYVLKDDFVVYAAHTRHPSSLGFQPTQWEPKVTRFLDWVADRRAARA